ncbi:cation transporter [Methyloprofundus sedimenti]|uniref:Cation transporter n=1 Tax=Methyloprofundus sedimenti TaxID=1420851 RepID=A0A1V8M111_9GAMM|nr:cation diffusion facilitator family transporter [Methyloprofundus sedimenti]OQK15247.1 cation transporter [Methyloprofundus sedimenti]
MSEAGDVMKMTKLKNRVTIVGALVNVFLSIIKISFGMLGQSAALIADGVHSLSDLASDLLVLVAVKFGAREADHDHPYGHRRFETIATVVLGVGLIVVAAGIAWDVYERMLQPERILIPHPSAMGIAAISILANEWLYQYTKRIATFTRSKLLLANAWHHRSDAISSIVVLIGVAGSLLGYIWADAVAAVIVTLMVAKIGVNLVSDSIKELVDTSLSEEMVDKIRAEIAATEGVRNIHLLRTRQMGEDALVDAHIVVNSRITVSEGHMIADVVRDVLIDKFDDVQEVLVHVDPENDEYLIEQDKVLLRQDIDAYLQRYLAENYHLIDSFRIHYIKGNVELEVVLPQTMFSLSQQVSTIKNRCLVLEQEVEQISSVLVFFKA